MTLLMRLSVLLAGLIPAWAQAQKGPRPAKYQTENFRLSAGPSSAEGYPMTIRFGAFVGSDGKNIVVPSGHYLNSKGPWNVSSRAWAVGEETQPAPEHLEILYFSYTENTFYEGKFPLPQQRIYDLLKQGFWNTTTRQPATYNELTVCVLPKGLVVVWLAGPGRQTLVGHYRAQVSNADWQHFNPGVDRAQAVRTRQDQLLPAVQQEIKAGTISSRKWESYLLTYSWQVALPPGLTLSTYNLGYWSGEYTRGPDTADPAPYVQALLTPHVRPAPSGAYWRVRDEAGHYYRLRVRQFEETETLAAFRTLHQASPNTPLTLQVEADKYLKEVKLMLTNGSQSLPLTKTPVEVGPL